MYRVLNFTSDYLVNIKNMFLKNNDEITIDYK